MKTTRELITELSKKVEEIKEVQLKRFYKSTDDYTVFADETSAGFTIKVNPRAGWINDLNNPNRFKLMEGGRERGNVTWREGNVAQVAKVMFDQNDKAGGEAQGLKVDDYVKILNMFTKAKQEAGTQYK
jgi:hypothetical protein